MYNDTSVRYCGREVRSTTNNYVDICQHVNYICMFIQRSKASTDTPLPTPTHRYNAWADDRKSLGITPHARGEGGGREGGEESIKFVSEEEKAEWEEEQKVLDVLLHLEWLVWSHDWN